MDQSQHSPKFLPPIPFKIDREQLQRILHVRSESRYYPQLMRLVEEAEALAHPKAAYRQAFVGERGEDWVELDGRRMVSRVMRVNLEDSERAFFFVATCGMELEEWSLSITDMLEKFWADAIKEMALGVAVRALEENLLKRYHFSEISAMHPGSLEDWPLKAQEDVFAMLGDAPAELGVTLTPSFVMRPVKSVSGIYFPTLSSFASCMLCPKENCRSRKAPFDAELFAKRYQVSTKAG
ncbi:MAG: vitamin B12 dependent methionine synthase [Anaerolineales bacterium]